jgi:hypothetical protein
MVTDTDGAERAVRGVLGRGHYGHVRRWISRAGLALDWTDDSSWGKWLRPVSEHKLGVGETV